MKMSNFLPMLEPLDEQNPQSGFMRRAMTPNDSTDSGIIERIMYGAKQGFISPEVVNYLLENLLEDDKASNTAIRGLMPAPRMPEQMDVMQKGLLR